MENQKILSISVAAYNLEKYIEQNLQSFINAKCRDYIEVLVVDDGSKDNTANSVEDYQKKYPNTIRLIKQKNSGAGSTVNTGLKYATGKYFKIVDGDDWVNTQHLEVFIEHLKEVDADMVITNYDKYSETHNKIIKKNKVDLPKNKILEFSQFSNNVYINMYSFTYKTSILKENRIQLDNGFYTDVEYILFPMPYIKNFIYFELSVYIYRVGREGQSVNIKSMQKNLKAHDLVLNHLIKFYEENKQNINHNTKKFLSRRIAIMAWTQINTLLTLKDDKNMKKNIEELILKIKSSSIDIYNELKKIKYARWMVNSNYKVVGLLSKLKLLKLKILKLGKRI